MNGWVGTTHAKDFAAGLSNYRCYLKETDVTMPGPARTWLLIDEHELSINDGWFVVDMSNSLPFADFPATRHNNGCTFTFADGHAEAWRWKEARTMEISRMPGWLSWPPHPSLGVEDRDFGRIIQGVPEKVPIL